MPGADSSSGRQGVSPVCEGKPADVVSDNGAAPVKDAAGSVMLDGAVEACAGGMVSMQAPGQATSTCTVSAAGFQAPEGMHEHLETLAAASLSPATASSLAELAPPLHAGLQQQGGIPFGSQFDVTMGVDVFEQLGEAVPVAVAETAEELALASEDIRIGSMSKHLAVEVAVPVQPSDADNPAGVWQDPGAGLSPEQTSEAGAALAATDLGLGDSQHESQHADERAGAAAQISGLAASEAEARSAPQSSASAALSAVEQEAVSILFGPATALEAAPVSSSVANPFGADDIGEDDESSFFAGLGSTGEP